MATLSESDQRVLDSIFNPNQTFGYEITPEETPASEFIVNGNGGLETDAERKAKELEISAVRKADENDIDGALSCLDEAVECSPDLASVYNNRAQVFLLKGDKASASSDLEKALELCHSEGKVAGQAFTQRALIHRLNGNDEAALEDFQRGSRLGNSFAKSQVAEMNPYAALCNQMLAQAIGKLRRGECDQ